MGETVGDTETILPGEVPEGEFQSVTVGKKFSLPAISAKSKSWELPAELRSNSCRRDVTRTYLIKN